MMLTDARSGVYEKCRICTCRLRGPEGDDLARGVCTSCMGRPEARRLGDDAPPDLGKLTPARAFTPAERALIAKMHSILPVANLLALLNERLAADLGPEASRYTLEQLQDAIRAIGGAADGPASAAQRTAGAGPGGWAALRRLLAQARRDGILKQISADVIEDFAVVFSLNARQVLTLKEVLLADQEDDDD